MPSGDEPTRFVILAAPRTGSNMLCTILGAHPRILCHHEIFNPSGIFYSLELREGGFSLGTIEEREGDPVGFVQRIWRTTLGRDCVGFKMTRGQNQAALDAVLADSSVKKILLRRQNRVKRYVSWLVAQQSGQWEAYGAEDLTDPRPQVRVEPRAFQQHMELDEQYYAQIEGSLRAQGQRWLDVAYERLFGHEERMRVLEFLGVPPGASPLEPKSVRQNPPDLRELIINFDELDAAWRGTELGRELHSRE
jgi:LPS sulfotransferase NodH